MKNQVASLESEIHDLKRAAATNSTANSTSEASDSAADNTSSAQSSSDSTSSTQSNSASSTVMVVDSNGIKVGSVAIDNNEIATLQAQVDSGHQPWRLDALSVAQADALAYGSVSSDADVFFILSQSSSTGVTEIVAKHNSKSYKIKIIKPVLGDNKIWTISAVTAN